MPLIEKRNLVSFGAGLLVKKGVPAGNAQYIAEMAVATEAFGIATHGLAFFAYAESAIPAHLDPKAEPTVVRETGAAALIEGRGGFGQLAMRLAGELAMKKARRQGIGMVAVRNVGWLGALGVHLVPIARQGFFAQLWAQTNTCKDCAPIGGIDAKFSTNPLALAFPTPDRPVVADFSTATMSVGKVNQMLRLGTKAPEKVFMDRDGKLSDDPRVVKDGGSILFAGGEHFGHKGYALSLWSEALTAMSGGECNNPESKTMQNFNLTVVDPDAFAGSDAYLREMERFLLHMKASRLLPGHAGIRLPGERALDSMQRAESSVPVEDHMAARLDELATRYGLEPIERASA